MVTVRDELIKTLLAEMCWRGRCSLVDLRADCESALRVLMTLYAGSNLTHTSPDQHRFRAAGHGGIYDAIRALVTHIGWLSLSDADLKERYDLYAADLPADMERVTHLQPAIDRASAVMRLCTPPTELCGAYELVAEDECSRVCQRTPHHGLDLAACKMPLALADYIDATRAAWIAHWEEREELITIVDLPAALGFDEATAYVDWAVRHLKTKDGLRVGTEQAEWHVVNCAGRPLKRLWWPDYNLDLVMAALLIFGGKPTTTVSNWDCVFTLMLILLYGTRGYGCAKRKTADGHICSLEVLLSTSRRKYKVIPYGHRQAAP